VAARSETEKPKIKTTQKKETKKKTTFLNSFSAMKDQQQNNHRVRCGEYKNFPVLVVVSQAQVIKFCCYGSGKIITCS
jgi:hypothetical protein